MDKVRAKEMAKGMVKEMTKKMEKEITVAMGKTISHRASTRMTESTTRRRMMTLKEHLLMRMCRRPRKRHRTQSSCDTKSKKLTRWLTLSI